MTSRKFVVVKLLLFASDRSKEIWEFDDNDEGVEPLKVGLEFKTLFFLFSFFLGGGVLVLAVACPLN